MFYNILLGADYLDCRPLVNLCLAILASLIDKDFNCFTTVTGANKEKSMEGIKRALENNPWFEAVQFTLDSPLT